MIIFKGVDFSQPEFFIMEVNLVATNIIYEIRAT